MALYKIYIWNLCDLHEQFWCVFSYYQHEENFTTRVTFEIFVTLMNNFHVSAQEISLSKWFSTRFTFDIFATFMNSLMCLLIWFSISNFYSLIFSDNIFCFKICLWQFFYKIDIELWLIIMWDFQLIWIQCWFGIFFRFFPIIFVIQNIRAQSLPNHKHFEVYYSYKKACRVSIWRPIYRLIVDTLLQLFMKK